MTAPTKLPEASEGSSHWAPIIWGIGIGVSLGLVVTAVILLEQKHLMPDWLIAWISNDRETQQRQLVRILFGLITVLVSTQLLRIGFFGEIAKTTYKGILSKLKFSHGQPDKKTHERICAVKNLRSALLLVVFFTLEVFLSWRALGKPFLEHSLYSLLFRIVLSILVFPALLNIFRCVPERFILAIVTIRIATGWVIEFAPSLAVSAAGLVRQTNLVLWVLALLTSLAMLISAFTTSRSTQEGSQPRQANFTADR